MKYEELGDSIIFDVKTDRMGKWGIVDALTQVNLFWKTVAHYEVFRRKDFDSIIVKINRDGVIVPPILRCYKCGSTRIRTVYDDDEMTNPILHDCTECSHNWNPAPIPDSLPRTKKEPKKPDLKSLRKIHDW